MHERSNMKTWKVYLKGVLVDEFATKESCKEFVAESFLPSEIEDIRVSFNSNEFVMQDGELVITVSTPGSSAAISAGCTCPVIDNSYGKGFLLEDKRCFWYAADCPVHTKKEQAK